MDIIGDLSDFVDVPLLNRFERYLRQLDVRIVVDATSVAGILVSHLRSESIISEILFILIIKKIYLLYL